MFRVSFIVLIEVQNFILWKSQKTPKQPQNLNTEPSFVPRFCDSETASFENVIFYTIIFLVLSQEMTDTEFLCTDNFLLICVKLHI